MPTHSEIRDRLRDAALAATSRDAKGLAGTGEWLEGLSGRDLLRVDGVARQFWPGEPVLGKSQRWTRAVVEASDVSAAIGSMHRDGHVRERCVARLVASSSALSDRMIALRVGDHVGAVRRPASASLMARTSLDHAARMMPILQRLDQRDRGAEAARDYYALLLRTHGADVVGAALRGSTDRDLRRWAFRDGIARSLIGADDAVVLLPPERDQVVRRELTRLVAEHGSPQSVRHVLLHGRSAEGRVTALVRLQASDLTEADVLPLLADPSVLTRMWARKRWEELGGDAQRACRDLIEAAPSPARRARAYVALSETGGRVDRPEILRLVHEPHPALQRVGLRLLLPTVAAEDVPVLLTLMRSPSSKVARAAVDALSAYLALWSLTDLVELKTDSDPTVRRRAWRLHRSRGGWESLISDLEILGDSDQALARLGAQPHAPMYLTPTDDQRTRITALLRDAPLVRDAKVEIAFAAGLRDLTDELRTADETAADDTANRKPRRPWWRAYFPE